MERSALDGVSAGTLIMIVIFESGIGVGSSMRKGGVGLFSVVSDVANIEQAEQNKMKVNRIGEIRVFILMFVDQNEEVFVYKDRYLGSCGLELRTLDHVFLLWVVIEDTPFEV